MSATTMNLGAWRDASPRDDDDQPLRGLSTRLLATGELLGASFHVTALRVKDDRGDQVAFDENDDDELDAVSALDERGAFETVTIPGFDGEWVVYATPFVS